MQAKVPSYAMTLQATTSFRDVMHDEGIQNQHPANNCHRRCRPLSLLGCMDVTYSNLSHRRNHSWSVDRHSEGLAKH